jgi:recombination protein RecA
MNSALLRAHVETALKDRFPSPFTYSEPASPETISTGIPALDQVTGGLPRGGLTEICGPESSGRTALLLSVLAEASGTGELCALLDGRDALDPHSAAAAGVDLTRLLWVRCRELEQALRSAELLLQGGGFGVVAIDLAGVSASLMRRLSLSVWFRLRAAVRNTRTALIVLERQPTVGTSASLVVQLQAKAVRWSALPEISGKAASPDLFAEHGLRCPSHARLLAGFQSSAEALRSRRRFQPGARALLKVRAAWR